MPGPEVDRVEPAGGEVGDVRPGLLRLDREAARRAQALDERGAKRDVGGGGGLDDLELAADELAQPRLGLGEGAVRGVAEVERASTRAGMTLSRCRSRRSG